MLSVDSRGKAVHLLNAAVASKKRKRPAEERVLMDLPLSLGMARPRPTYMRRME
jgi:hypothetical protein